MNEERSNVAVALQLGVSTHPHVVHAKEIQVRTKGLVLEFEVPEGGYVGHAYHKPVVLEPGTWVRTTQVEYNLAKGMPEIVQD